MSMTREKITKAATHSTLEKKTKYLRGKKGREWFRVWSFVGRNKIKGKKSIRTYLVNG